MRKVLLGTFEQLRYVKALECGSLRIGYVLIPFPNLVKLKDTLAQFECLRTLECFVQNERLFFLVCEDVEEFLSYHTRIFPRPDDDTVAVLTLMDTWEASRNELCNVCVCEDGTWFLRVSELIIDKTSSSLLKLSQLSSIMQNTEVVTSSLREFILWEQQEFRNFSSMRYDWWKLQLKQCRSIHFNSVWREAKGAVEYQGVSFTVPKSVSFVVDQTASRAGISQFFIWVGLFARWCWRNSDWTFGRNAIALIGSINRRDRVTFQSVIGNLRTLVGFVFPEECFLKDSFYEFACACSEIVLECVQQGSTYPFAIFLKCMTDFVGDTVFPCFSHSPTASLLEDNFTIFQPDKLLTLSVCGENCVSIKAGGSLEASVYFSACHGCISSVSFAREREMREILLQQEEWDGPFFASQVATFQRALHQRALYKSERTLSFPSFAEKIISVACVVGLYMRRSSRLVKVVHALVMQGAAFLPLDRDYNWAVVHHRLQNSNSKACMIEKASIPLFSVNTVRVLLPDHFHEKAKNPPAACRVSDPAYMFFTSGSTGAPKGTVIHQSNAACLLSSWLCSEFQLNPWDVFLWQSSISFDALIYQIFWPYIAKASVCLIVEEKQLDKAAIFQTMLLHKVSCALMVPSQATLLFQADARRLEHFSLFISGGEALSKQVVDSVAQRLPRAIFRNEFGPTEATVAFLHFVIKSERIKNRQTLQLDELRYAMQLYWKRIEMGHLHDLQCRDQTWEVGT